MQVLTDEEISACARASLDNAGQVNQWAFARAIESAVQKKVATPAAEGRWRITPKNGGAPYFSAAAPDTWEVRECDIQWVPQAGGEARPDVPTTWMERFRQALTKMCGATPPEDMCQEWLDKVSINGVDRLQDWVVNQSGTPTWAQGLVTIEVATQWADEPTEGVPHEYRD